MIAAENLKESLHVVVLQKHLHGRKKVVDMYRVAGSCTMAGNDAEAQHHHKC